MAAPRTILHVDMDAFYASVEQRDRPELRGKPVIVGGSGGRGVVASASYEARAKGVSSAMPMAMAMRRSPEAVQIKPRMQRYQEVSREILAILEQFSPLVEPVSIDEAFLDATGCERLLGDGPTIARAIRRKVKDALDLPCSAGVGPNKFCAKLASDMAKPDGLAVLAEEGLAEALAELPIEKMWGVGPAGAAKFRAAGYRTFGDLQKADERDLAKRFGEGSVRLRALAAGLDDRAVTPDREAKSVGQERTFSVDLEDPEQQQAELRRFAEQIGERLRRHHRMAWEVSVKIRTPEYRTFSRSRRLDEGADTTGAIGDVACALLDEFLREFARGRPQPLRLLGVTASALTPKEGPGAQRPLFEDPSRERDRRIDRAADSVRDRFGRGSVQRGGPEPRRGS
ncbi:MAG: DNA polymerase IV [Phycisphaerae bacterium]|nr:DNA polymerase IV [Phycisphaerae bacterium]